MVNLSSRHSQIRFFYKIISNYIKQLNVTSRNSCKIYSFARVGSLSDNAEGSNGKNFHCKLCVDAFCLDYCTLTSEKTVYSNCCMPLPIAENHSRPNKWLSFFASAENRFV